MGASCYEELVFYDSDGDPIIIGEWYFAYGIFYRCSSIGDDGFVSLNVIESYTNKIITVRTKIPILLSRYTPTEKELEKWMVAKMKS